jgi:hypothetical protein
MKTQKPISISKLLKKGATKIDWDRGNPPVFKTIAITEDNNQFFSADRKLSLRIHHMIFDAESRQFRSRLLRRHQSSPTNPGWPGNFDLDEPVLWTDNITSLDESTILLMFDTPVSAVGARIQTRDMGSFTASMIAVDSKNNELTTGLIAGDSTNKADNSAIFLGLEVPGITKIVFTCQSSPLGFAINSPLVLP